MSCGERDYEQDELDWEEEIARERRLAKIEEQLVELRAELVRLINEHEQT